MAQTVLCARKQIFGCQRKLLFGVLRAASDFDSIFRGIQRGSQRGSVWACFPAGPLERPFEEGIQGGFEGRGP